VPEKPSPFQAIGRDHLSWLLGCSSFDRDASTGLEVPVAVRFPEDGGLNHRYERLPDTDHLFAHPNIGTRVCPSPVAKENLRVLKHDGVQSLFSSEAPGESHHFLRDEILARHSH